MSLLQQHNDTTTKPSLKIPRHVAIIMDGNGRWARERGFERSAGHVEGVNTVRHITEESSKLGIKHLTLYAFSTENWNRPVEEVDILMHLIVTAIERETPDLIKNNVRLSVIGDMSRMPREAYERLMKCIDDTSAGTGLNLILAISYSSRWEITEACRTIARRVAAGEITPDSINPELISDTLATRGVPDPDLLIRTGGDMRISNFLLWQLAYTEIYVTPKYWPDFNGHDLLKAIESFNSRQRRFGLTGDQIESASATADSPTSD